MTARADQVDALREALTRLDRKTNEEWMASLDSRKRAELQFHDLDRSAGTPDDPEHLDRQTSNKKYYSTTGASRRFIESWLAEHAKGRVFLDYACGNGLFSLAAARAGAALAVGLDISRTSIQNARALSGAAGLTGNTWFVQGDCENTGLPDESVDTVLCSGMLHHLDLNHAFPELRRIMRPGARLLAYEALNYNPVLKLYRRLTPGMRTEWEKRHILSHRELRFARRFFDVEAVRYWHLFSLFATPFRSTPLFGSALAVTNGLDEIALQIPGLRLMAWMFTFELVKR
ncbi:MAG: class I SAM-dependent methyltransferase [Acidimicrobiia bacterium]|nr:class I SAM-dependent methyltransferase [Acidimicrobiia bacterium]